MPSKVRAYALAPTQTIIQHPLLGSNLQDVYRRGREQSPDAFRCIVVTHERACSICHKRMGISAFVAFPEGNLAHYSCHKRQSRTSVVAGETPPSSTAPVFDVSND